MRSALRYTTGLTLLFLVWGLSAGARAQDPATAPASYNPATLADYDQITASVPRSEAPIPSVALARITIALHNARHNAEHALCGGRWAPRGNLLVATDADRRALPVAAPGGDRWQYNALRKARPLACDTVSRSEFFQEMSRHLPAWIQVRPAGQHSAYRQGRAVIPPGPQTVAVR